MFIRAFRSCGTLADNRTMFTCYWFSYVPSLNLAFDANWEGSVRNLAAYANPRHLHIVGTNGIVKRLLHISFIYVHIYVYTICVCMYIHMCNMHVHIDSADSPGELEIREKITFRFAHARERLIRVISGITSIYPCYLRRKRSVFRRAEAGINISGVT